LQYRTLERKQKETNSAGGEADEVIVMTNNGLFCDRTAWCVQTFITQLLSECSVLSTINITEGFQAQIAAK